MKSFIKLAVAVIAVLAVIFTGANIILHNENKGDAGRPYRVEAERIAARIENREPYSLNDYSYIKNVEIQENGFQGGDSDYLVKEIGGKLYRFDYSYQADNTSAITSFNICFGVTAAFVLLLLLFLFIRIIRPFEKISTYPTELAKGNLTAPLKDSKSKYFGKFLWGLDLLREKLESQRSAELALQKQNKTMVLSLSHDIKTPLTSIINYVDLMKKENITDPTLLEYMDVLDRQSSRLKKLIEDLMEASKASTGNLTVNLEECDVTVMLSQAVGEFEEKMVQKGLIPVITYPEEKVVLSADGRHLWRVFDNLLNNICKYAQPSTRVYINVDKNGQELNIIFKNISSSQLNISSEELMERFVRGDSSRNTEGSGLGLSIAKSLTELMNGRLELCVDGDLFKVTLIFPV